MADLAGKKSSSNSSNSSNSSSSSRISNLPRRLWYRAILLLLSVAAVRMRVDSFLSGALFAGLVSRSPSTGQFGPLRFHDDGSFHISIFEDLHFGENPWDSWGPQQDIQSVKVLEKVLDADPPDLVVLNGDLITGENTYLHNSTLLVDQIVQPILDRGLTWASTYGNHDHNTNISGQGILEREHRWPNARTASMVSGRLAGVSNYYLPVYPARCPPAPSAAEEPPCGPDLILWFFDSRGGFYTQEFDEDGDPLAQPDWVDTSVVDWFRTTNAQLVRQHGRVIPSLAFVHIPTNASRALQQERGVDANCQPGINDDVPLAPQAGGWCADGTNGDDCEYGGQDLPFMRAVTTTPGLLGLFSGHDHGDTWCYKWEGVLTGMTVDGNGLNLCFGQHSGYGGYGSWIRGARQVLVTRDALEHRSVDTWIRLESGDSVGAVSLNATYNQDRYPATPNDKTRCPTCNCAPNLAHARY
ncbi:hypothetical protein GMORB2_7141 [Geosmithia morbida]|uniref:Calcineurin-like phosphoesterase domain-containing protein n=1 Tax=Geosmithia morbida TaxID=1094350 RepID=A0A9P4YXI1_9HYPO|nr:uncharacterized protein GMORB2_7141 [Geosmithia morbida]KAF4122834.1 hypothetical protein GMORB2_7141 [Geosmithia morbida]